MGTILNSGSVRECVSMSTRSEGPALLCFVATAGVLLAQTLQDYTTRQPDYLASAPGLPVCHRFRLRFGPHRGFLNQPHREICRSPPRDLGLVPGAFSPQTK